MQHSQPPEREPFEYRLGTLSEGFDAAEKRVLSIEVAIDLCRKIEVCAGFSYNSSEPRPSGKVMVEFKTDVLYSRSVEDPRSPYCECTIS